MHFTKSTTGLLLGLMSIWSCSAAPAEEVGLAVPKTCSKKKTACHTYTAYTTPAACPKQQCPNLGDIMCIQIVSVTTSNVPCADACCPNTKTKTVTTPCPKCPTGCVIPTITETRTTGCKATATGPVLTGGGGSVTLIPGGGGAPTPTVTLKPGKL